MTEPDVSVRFFVHSDSPVPARRRRVARRLEELTARGAIGSYELELWPKVISLDATDGRSDDVVETFDALADWAEGAGVSITPPFTVRTDEWQVTGEHDRRLHTPNMCLAVYEAGDLATVYPHRCSDGVRTVRDGLAALEPDPDDQGIDPRPDAADGDPGLEDPTNRLETDPEDSPAEPIDR